MKWNCSSLELLVLLLVLSSINCAVINLKKGDACALACSGKENIFKYEENKIYVYNFLSRHSVKNPNSKDETLQLELQGKAEVSKISACDFGLMLSGVKLKESIKGTSISKEYGMMKTLLEKYPLRFGFDDGRITGVCPETVDNEFAVNVKKGILSSLQVSLDSLDTPNYLTETDISGDCITEYTTKSEPPNFVIVTKKKSIAGCSRKTKYYTTISGRVHELPKESRNLALLDGSYNCEIKVKRSEGLKESICEESHTFKPFQSEAEGSQILINQELKFDSMKDGKINAKVPTIRSDLTMSHGDKKPMSMQTKVSDPKIVLQQFCTSVKENAMSIKITELFLSLIRSLESSSYEDIKSLDKMIMDDPICAPNKLKIRNLLFDVLSNVKTDAAFKFLIEDAKIYKFSKLGFSIFDSPTSAMIGTLSKALDEPSSFNSISTILSSMIKSFCCTTPGCMLNPEIIKVMTKLKDTLGQNCHHSDKKILQKIPYSLRALSNAGSYPNMESLINTIKMCVSKKSHNNDIKVYSAQVFREFPCNEDVDKFLWTIFDDVSYSSEVRIEAYLSLVRCPSRTIFGQIIQRLSSEQSQQLGSFVWSHISNLMESADRFKYDVRDMLQIYTTPMNALEKRFNLDFRSYSKNIEKTYQRGYSSAKIDSNIIFSSSSPIPSSVNINATFEIFGRSINLFEIGIRGKGISEKIFGKEHKPKAHGSPHPDIVKMHHKISKPKDKLSVSLYSRIMGREVYFTPNLIGDLTMSVMSMNNKPSFERSMLLLDTTVSIASITGFPVELQIESAASVNFNMEMNKDMAANNFQLSTQSNYGIQVTGKLLVNAHCTKIGVQTKGTVSKDVSFGGKLILKKGVSSVDNDYLFELNKIPDNSKLFSISNELSLIHKLERPETVDKYDTILEKCTGEGMMKIMGVKVCLSYKEAPRFSSILPNIKAQISIDKFSGLKLVWKKESHLTPIRKLKSLLVSASFPGAEEDTFRLKIDRDSKLKRYIYEILLWKKLSYVKFDINDKQITGQIKCGSNEATLSGTVSAKGIFVSEMNVELKSEKNSGKLYFFQKFTKDGPEVILRISKNGDKGFNLESRTNLRLTDHKIFNFFQRFRHSTNLKFYGDNEMNLILETSQGNKPLAEYKSKFNLFWTTKTKRNFYVNQIFLWQKISDIDYSDLFRKVSGTKNTLNIDHEIEVKEKKFNVTNTFTYFVSDDFLQIRRKPSVFMITFKREDLIKKEILVEASSRFGAYFSKYDDGNFMMEHLLNYPALKINKRISSKMTWTFTDFGHVIFFAEHKGIFFQILIEQKSTTPLDVLTNAELKVGDSIYKLKGELKNSGTHTLAIYWPKNNIEIISKLIKKEAFPTDFSINQEVKMNTVLLFKLEHSYKGKAGYKNFEINSVGKTSENNELYFFNILRKLDYDVSSTKVFYDYLSTTTLRIPGVKFNKQLSIEQFADISLIDERKMKTKTFVSKIVLENLEEKKKTGYELNVKGEKDSIQYRNLELVMFTKESDNKISLKYGREGYNILIGGSLDFAKTVNAEMMWNLNVRNKVIQRNILLLLDAKNNKMYNMYLKQRTVLNLSVENKITIISEGEFGRDKTFVTPIMSSLTILYKGFRKLDLSLNLSNLSTIFPIEDLNYALSYNFEGNSLANTKVSFNKYLKWKNPVKRNIYYYEVAINADGSAKSGMSEINMILTKDSPQNEILTIKVVSNKGQTLEIDIKSGAMFAKLVLSSKMKETGDLEAKLMLTSSHESMKELSILLEHKLNSKTTSQVCNIALNSFKQNYKLTVSKLRKEDFQDKIDLVEQVNWTSNIRYIDSGSVDFGVLLQNRIFQCKLNVLHQQLKIVDFKIETSDITKNLIVLIASSVTIQRKFQTKYAIEGGKITHELDLTYNREFFRISKLELSGKKTGKIISWSANVIIKTSRKGLEEITYTSATNMDIENMLVTLKRNVEVKINGTQFEYCSIDLKKGEIEMKSIAGQLIPALNYKSLEVSLKYKFQSIRDFMLEYKSVLDKSPRTAFSLTYFRKLENEPARKFDTLDEAKFFAKMELKSQSCLTKLLVFIEKDRKSAIVKMEADHPSIKLKIDEVTMSFTNIKGSDNLYTGDVKYKNVQYMFTYEKSVGYKRKLQIKAINKSSKPQEINFRFDFTKDYTLKLSFDDYFDIDVQMNAQTPNSRSGIMKYVYQKNEIININTVSKLVIPPEVNSMYSFFKALFGLLTGLEFTFKIDGKIMQIPVKSNLEISHLKSKLFPEGRKSDFVLKFEYFDGNVKQFSVKEAFDGNFLTFKFEQSFEMMIDGETSFLKNFKMMYKSWNDMYFDHSLNSASIRSGISFINNDNRVKGTYYYSFADYGLEFLKKTYDVSLIKSIKNVNTTLETNLGYIIKTIMEKSYGTGKLYYIKAKKGSESYEIQFQVKKKWNAVISLKNEVESRIKKVVLTTVNEWETKNNLGFEVAFESSSGKLSGVLKTYVKFNKALTKMTLTSNLKMNRESVADLVVDCLSNNGKSPYKLKMKYKGTYLVTGDAELNTKKNKFSYTVDVKDGKFKTPLWTSLSNCILSPEMDCEFIHTNKARVIKTGATWKSDLKILEFSWNKKAKRGFLFMSETKGKNTKMTISSPVRTINITYIKKSVGGNSTKKLTVEVIRHADPSKPVTFSLEYVMKGSLKTDYNLDIQLNSNLLQKGFKISINRQVSMNIGDLYTLNIKAMFDDAQRPFFTLEGYLRQLSSRSYEMMINATNNEKFLTLTTKTSFTYEEISFEYKVDRENKKTKEFIFQFIPFRKFLISNKNDLEILISRTIYQYGYRRDIVWKIGQNGPNIVAFATLIKSPLKYYAEVSGNNKKLIVHFRPVGNTFIGEVYRKVNGVKLLDMSLKAGIDSNSILTANLFWNPKSVEDLKICFDTATKPEYIQSFLTNSFKNTDSAVSSFTSSVKMELIKKLNMDTSLDFVKNIAYDMEQIPNTFAQSYEEDSLFMKSLMISCHSFLKSIDIQWAFLRIESVIREFFGGVTNQIYECFVRAQPYVAIQGFLSDQLNTMTYDKIKMRIEGMTLCVKMIGSIINSQIVAIGNILDSLSERARMVSILTSDLQQTIQALYEGSSINKMMVLLGEIKEEALNGLGQVMETDFMKERLVYYKESIDNMKDMIRIMFEMKAQIFKYIRSSSPLGNILETIKLIRTMKYKDAFLNMIKPEEAKLEMNLDKATMDMRIYVSPLLRVGLKMWKRTSDWFPAQLLSQMRGSGFGGKLLALFYRYEYLIFNYGSMKSLKKLLPPFKKSAWVIGGNSILTYDGSSIRIGSGKCSYLLARDAKEGSFSLIMNIIKSYSKDKEFELSYINKVTILSSGKVKVDGVMVETLPKLISTNGKTIEIYRDFDVTKVKTSEGVTVEYFHALDYLKVSLTGFWHGSVMGLLGSNDFDVVNDWSTPNGRITHDAGILSKSWSLNSCKSETLTGLYSIKVDKDQLQGCINLFKKDSTSYLFRCFSLINPEPYYELCQLSLQYKKMTKKEHKEVLCDLSRNYVMRCKSKGMMIRLKKDCVKCGSMKLSDSGKEINLKSNPKFNIIFIVEQSKCLAPYKTLIDDLLSIIALQKNNIYTLMSFNGKDIFKSAHFKSLTNEITTESKGFKRLLSELISPSQTSDLPAYNSSTQGSQAIYDAIKMPSKPGYIEKIVFVSCSACGEHKKYVYSTLAGLLDNAGISFTYLTTQPFIGTSSTSKSVGLGNKMVHYFEKDLLKTRSDNKDLQAPNDVCSSLARLKDGFVWSLKSMTSKMQLRRVAETLLADLTKVKGKPKQKCTCGTGNYEEGKVECKVRGIM